MSDEALDEIIQSLGTFIKYGVTWFDFLIVCRVVTKRAEIFGLIGIISVMKQLPRNFQEKSAKIFPYLVTAMHNFEVKVKQITENESNSEDKPAFPMFVIFFIYLFCPVPQKLTRETKVMNTWIQMTLMKTNTWEKVLPALISWVGHVTCPFMIFLGDVVISLQHDFYPDIYTPNFKLMFGDTVQSEFSPNFHWVF